jgi:hypothetical protein
MKPVTLEWLVVDEEHLVLVFDKFAFSAFQSIADARGVETTELITETLASLFGPVFVTRTNRSPYN